MRSPYLGSYVGCLNIRCCITNVMDEVDLHICHECLAVFLFNEDLENHNAETGHKVSATKKAELIKFEDKVFAFFTAA